MWKPTARHRARECAVQALYSWQLSRNHISNIEHQFLSKLDKKSIDIIYFRELLLGVTNNVIYIDELIQPYLSRLFSELGEIEKAVLRVALFELSKRDDIPYKVVINEAIELAKTFGTEKCYKFINAILDKIAPLICKKKNKL